MKKIILYSAIVLSTFVMMVPAVSAQSAIQWVRANQQTVIAQPGEFEVKVGDTVMISKDQKYYLTGDTIRKWVYNVCPIVAKVGGKRFPDGVLLLNINTWISPKALSLVGPKREEVDTLPVPAAPVVPVFVEETIVEPVAEPVVEPVVEPVAEPVVEPVAEPVVEPVAEPVVEPVVEPVAPVSEAHCANRLSIGVRGGATSFLQDAGEAKYQLGFDALLDLQYAYYGITSQQHQIGFLIGVSAGYTQDGMKMDALRDQFNASTSDGDIQYTVSADNIVENHGLVTVEVPVMFSLVTRGGFFMNIGPRVQIPVYSFYTMRYSNPNMEAYFTKERVTVENALITGRLGTDDVRGEFAVKKYSILAGLELGYEWKLTNGDALALGAFADYNLYTLYKGGEDIQRVFNIIPPSSTMQPAQVEYNSLRDVYGRKSMFLDCGLKLTYHFVVGKSTLK